MKSMLKCPIALCLGLLALLVPIIYVPGIFDFTLHPRQMAIQIGLIFCMGFLLRLPKSNLSTPILLPLLCFAAWSIASIMWAINPVESLLQANRLILFLLVAWVAARSLDGMGIKIVYACAGLSAFLVSCVGISQYFGWAFSDLPTVGNPSATFGYRNFAASYLVTLLPIVIVFACQVQQRSVFAASTLTAVLMATFLIYTRTRGAWLGLLGAMFTGGVVLLYHMHNKTGLFKMSVGRLMVIVACIGLVLVAARLPDHMQNTGKFGFDERKIDAVTTLSNALSADHSRGRLTIWRHTLDMVADHVLVGVGLGSWQFVYPRYDRGDWITRNAAPIRPHNDLLWILAETGIIGFGFYIWFLGTLLYLVWQHMKHHPTPESLYVFGITLGLLAYTGDSFFSFPKERMESTLMFWIGVGAIMHQTASDKPGTFDMRPIAWMSIPVLLCGLSLSYRHLRFDEHYLKAQSAWREKNWPRLQTETETAWKWGPFNQRAMLLNGLSYQQQQKYSEAIAAYQTAQQYHPNDGHDALASVYAALGKWDLAIKHHRAECNLYPNLPDPWLALINTYEQLEQIDNATNIAQQALEQGIRSAELMMRTGHLYQLQNNLEKAIEAYRQAQQLDPQNPVVFNNIGAILMRQKKYPEAEKAYLQALKVQPDYSRVYHNLGDLYATQGDTTKALKAYAMFIQAWQGDPRFAKLAEQKINALKNISPK